MPNTIGPEVANPWYIATFPNAVVTNQPGKQVNTPNANCRYQTTCEWEVTVEGDMMTGKCVPHVLEQPTWITAQKLTSANCPQ